MTDFEMAFRLATSELPEGWMIMLTMERNRAFVRLLRHGRHVTINTTGRLPADLISDAVRTAQALTRGVTT